MHRVLHSPRLTGDVWCLVSAKELKKERQPCLGSVTNIVVMSDGLEGTGDTVNDVIELLQLDSELVEVERRFEKETESCA